MGKKKAPKGNKNTLILVMAIVVAVGMVLSSLIIYIDYLRKPDYPSNSEQGDFQEQFRAAQKNLEQEAEQLEQYIEKYGPSLAVLERLGSIYSSLADYARLLEAEAGPKYLEKAAEIYGSLVEMEPDQVKYQFLLYSTYTGLELKEKADQQVHSIKELLEQKQAEGLLENLDRFYYALILEQADGNRQEALSQLAVILDTEPQESPLYSHAKEYREHLQLDDKISDEPD